MKKLFFALLIGATIVSCTKEEPVVDLAAPVISAPSSVTSVQVGETTTVSFSVTTAAGYVSASVSANGGTATITSQPSTGDTSGTIVVSYVAGTSSGAGSIVLSVVDAETDSSNGTAVLNLTAAPVVVTDLYYGENGGVTFIGSTNNHWTADYIHHISGKIVVLDGVTLTIDAGAIVKADDGQGEQASAIVVARGGKLIAEGTATNPIIFTAESDNITFGETVGSLSLEDKNLWGGIVLLGKATVGAGTGAAYIEGVPAAAWSEYGNADGTFVDDDNSGSLSYLSIRHSGIALSDGSELQGLTLGGVGSGTSIDNIEIVASGDDGIEIFGGKPVLTNILVWGQSDDGLDFDQAFGGSVTNALIVLDSDSDTGLEIDGTESEGDVIDAAYTLSNVTIVGSASPLAGKNRFADWKSDATGHNKNILFKDIASGLSIKGIDKDTYAGAGTAATIGALTYEGIEFISADTLAEIFTGLDASVLADYTDWASLVTTATVGADETVFDAWTWYKNQ